MSTDNEKEIIDKLKKLPKIADESDKDKIFSQIASRLGDEKSGLYKKKQSRYLPLLAVAVLIFIISIPLLLSNINNQTADNRPEISTGHESLMMQNEDEEEIAEFSFEESHRSEDSRVQDTSKADTVDSSRVIHSISNDSQLIHFSTYGEQLQYTIPISLIVSDEVEMKNFYNEKEEILATYDLLPDQYLLANVEYEINSSDQQVTVLIPDSFSLGDGSAQASIFRELLEDMFQPYGIEKVKFEIADANTADFGGLGMISELDFETNQQASYLLNKDNYFIRIPQNSHEIDEAINSLQRGIPDIDIHKTIPKSMNFELKEDNQTLIFEFISGSTNISSIMIESILLTAKSYNYENVLFENMPISELGEYQFSKPIAVPLGANPIKHSISP